MIQHPDGADHDDAVRLLAENGADSVLFAKATITDADGDSVTTFTALSGDGAGDAAIVFEDDGPKADLVAVSLEVSGDGELVHDESAGVPSLVLHASIPAGGLCKGKPCWKGAGAANKNGFRYSDRLTTNGSPNSRAETSRLKSRP